MLRLQHGRRRVEGTTQAHVGRRARRYRRPTGEAQSRAVPPVKRRDAWRGATPPGPRSMTTSGGGASLGAAARRWPSRSDERSPTHRALHRSVRAPRRGVSISFDGPVHDLNRLDRAGRGRTTASWQLSSGSWPTPRAIASSAASSLSIDPSSDPAAVYEALKATGTPSFDFFIATGITSRCRTANGQDRTEYGDWMVRLPLPVRSDAARVSACSTISCASSWAGGQKEGVGLTEYGIIVIDTDGTVTKNDTLKVAYAGGDRFGTSRLITDSDLLGVVHAKRVRRYYKLQEPTAPVCRRARSSTSAVEACRAPLLGRQRLRQPHRLLCRSTPSHRRAAASG